MLSNPSLLVLKLFNISDISDVLNGDRGKNYPSRAHYVDKGIPFISAGNIGNNKKGKIENFQRCMFSEDIEKSGS